VAKKSKRHPPPAVSSETIDDFWKNQRAKLGRGIVFVDSGAILEAYTPNDKTYGHFFQSAADRFVTSPFVIAETVRRFVKSKGQFRIPDGKNVAIACHFIQTWLEEHRVIVLHIPDEVFEAARKAFEEKHGIGCDLNDIISFQIVQGLEQDRIVAKDRHFSALGLTLLPGSAD
jgi:predicted nucleic acid-binding protein